MRLITLLIVCCVLSGCARVYATLYNLESGGVIKVKNYDFDLAEVGKHKNVRVEVLQPNQEPQIIETNNLDREYQNRYVAKYYRIVGYSSFDAHYEDKQYAIKQAKGVGATLVLVKDWGHAIDAWFLVKVLPITPPRFGFRMRDLSNQERVAAERNTGVFVEIVFEDTPMFYANTFQGDIIIAIDGIQVKNSAHWDQLTDGITGKSVTLTILRKGVQKDIVVQLDVPNDK